MKNVCVLLAAFFLSGCFSQGPKRSLFSAAIQENAGPFNAYAFIAHAGGGIDGRIYTNSLEAVQQSLGWGFRLIELDLLETTDGHLVAAHTWRDFRRMTGDGQDGISDAAMSLAEFKSRKIHDRYTPLDAAMIREILAANRDLWLVTDKSNNFDLILRELPFVDRMVVEVFGFENYKKALAAGIKHPMLSIDDVASDLAFVREHDVRLVAVHAQAFMENEKAFAKLYRAGTDVFVYSSNDVAFMRRYVGKSASAVYSDFWDPSQNICAHDVCTTY